MTLARPFQTARLELEPLHAGHAAALHALYAHPDAMRYMDEPPHVDVPATRDAIERMTGPGSCYWTIRLRQTAEAIGVAGFLGGTSVPGFGYILHPDHWKQGYMTEAVRGALNFGFDVLKFDRAELWIDLRNAASRRLAARLGFSQRTTFIQKYPHDARPHEKAVYGLTLEEWRGMPPVTPDVRGMSQEAVLAVHDVAATVAFYRDVLGFRVGYLVGDPPVHAGVSLGPWTRVGAALQLVQVPPDRALGAASSLYIHVGPDIDVLCDRFRTAGADVVEAPVTQPWGFREFAIRDLNGYLLRFSAPA